MTSGSVSIFPVALERVVTAAARTVAFADADDALLSNKSNLLPCPDCRRLGHRRPCFHQEVSDESVLDRLKEECRELLSTFDYLRDYPFKQSKVKCGHNQLRNPRNDDNHIDFDYTTCSVTRCVAFINLLK